MSEQDKIAAARCCCAEHHQNYGRCLQCPIHGITPPAAPVSGLVERLFAAGSTGADLSPGDPLCLEAAQALRESEEENKRWLAKAMLYAPQLESAESRLALARELLGEWLPICDEVLNNYWRKDAKDEDACMGWDDAKLTIGMLRRIRAFLKDQP